MTVGLHPYLAYRPSGAEWLGDVPSHWDVLSGRACYSSEQTLNKGMVEITVLTLSYGQIKIRPKEKLHGLVPESFETYQLVEPGDIVCRPTDLQNDWNSLRFGLSPYNGIITSAYMCLRTGVKLSRRYGHLLLHTYDLKKVFYGLGSGLRQNLSWTDFKLLPCLVPPLPEQRAIVRYLDYVDRRIRRYVSAKRKLIALLEEEKQAIINRAVTCGLDPNVRLKPSGVEWLGDVPEHWDVGPVKRAFLSMDCGISESASDSGTIRLLTMGHLKDGQVMVPDDGCVDFVAPHLLPEEGDLLFNRTNSQELVGKVGLFVGHDSPVTFASYLVRMRPHPNHEPAYSNMALNGASFTSRARREAIPSLHQSNLNPTRFGRIHIALPSKEEQCAILLALRKETANLEAAVARASRQIELVQEYRTRLIADVVTGKLNVREAAAQLPDEADDQDPIEESDPLADGLPEDLYDIDESVEDSVVEQEVTV